jgi:hypothetical protein
MTELKFDDPPDIYDIDLLYLNYTDRASEIRNFKFRPKTRRFGNWICQ